MRDTNQQLIRLLNYCFPAGRWLMGIPVQLHWSLLFLPVAMYWMSAIGGEYLPFWKLAVGAFIAAVMIVTFVYLHECGHAYAIRLYDLPVQKIRLHIVGGACVGPWLRSRREELVVTIFGPMVNLVFVVLSLGALFLWQWGASQPLRLMWFSCEFASFQATGMELLAFSFMVNFMLSAFNLLIPMFPMDSGRILRATLARWYTPLKATEIVVRVGIALGVVLIAGALVLVVYGALVPSYSSYIAHGGLLIALTFSVLLAGWQELQMARIQPVYNTYNAPYVMLSDDGEMEVEGDEWKQTTAPPPQPGFFARWRARRRQRKLEREAQAETERRERVDRLLEKISREGIDSLSKEEKTFLSSASKAFRNRVGSEMQPK